MPTPSLPRRTTTLPIGRRCKWCGPSGARRSRARHLWRSRSLWHARSPRSHTRSEWSLRPRQMRSRSVLQAPRKEVRRRCGRCHAAAARGGRKRQRSPSVAASLGGGVRRPQAARGSVPVGGASAGLTLRNSIGREQIAAVVSVRCRDGRVCVGTLRPALLLSIDGSCVRRAMPSRARPDALLPARSVLILLFLAHVSSSLHPLSRRHSGLACVLPARPALRSASHFCAVGASCACDQPDRRRSRFCWPLASRERVRG